MTKRERLEDQAILALLEEPTIQSAAARIGVDECTLRRWLREDDAFKKAYREARRDAFAQALGKSQARLSQGVDILWAIAQDAKASTASRINAFTQIKDLALKGYEMDVEARLDALEALLSERKDPS